MSTLTSKNVVVGSRRTSMRLEPTMWDALSTICERENQSIRGLVTEIDKWRGDTALTSAVRVFVLAYFQSLATTLESRLHSGQPALEPIAARSKGSSGAHEILTRVFGRR